MIINELWPDFKVQHLILVKFFLYYFIFLGKNTFVIAFSVGGIMNVTASLLMGIYVLLEVFVSAVD